MMQQICSIMAVEDMLTHCVSFSQARKAGEDKW